MRLSTVFSILIFVMMILWLQTGATAIPDPDSLNENQHSGDPSDETKVGTAFVLPLLTNSPRANGMGGCSITWIDEQSGIHNPGGLGLFHLNRVFAISIPGNTDWLPDLDAGLKLKSYSISIGGSHRLLYGTGHRMNIAAGFSYSNVTFDLGSFIATDYNGNTIGVYNLKTITRYYSAGLGIDYYCRLGFGLTYATMKDGYFNTDGYPTSSTGHTYNVGALFEVPLFDILPPLLNPNRDEHSIRFQLTPTASLFAMNPGNGTITYPAGTYILTNMTRYGFALTGSAGLKDATIVSVTFVAEQGRHMGQMLERRDGWEVALFNFFSLRGGRYKSEWYSDNYRSTHGFGIKLDGLIAWIRHYSPRTFQNGLPRYLADHASISFDYAKYGEDPNLPAQDHTEFFRVNISF